MSKNVLFRTNILVCSVIIIGFIVTALIGYQSNQGIFREDMEQVSTLTSEGIYHQIDSIFTKPINISLTMANDSLLKGFLKGENEHQDDPAFIETMRQYLNTYREKYGYDSVFLSSVQTKRYYYFNGLDRDLAPDNPENEWFYQFLEQNAEYTINIDNDEVEGAGNEITVFINCRILGTEEETIGVVGVGFRVDFLQSLQKGYEDKFGVKAYLVDDSGLVKISTDRTGYEEKIDLFEFCDFSELKDDLLKDTEEPQEVWYHNNDGSGYVISRYVPNLDWYLIVENNTTELDQRLAHQLLREVLIVLGTVLIVLITITGVIRRYNQRIVDLTIAHEKAHRAVFQKATEQLYENIYEIDISHNQAASEETEKYFESLGAPPNIPYDQALKVIAEKQIKEEFRQGYLDTFYSQNVLKAFQEGRDKLEYSFMISNDGENYYWMRIIAQIFRWAEDNSVRMLVYRQNIDEEKRRELFMSEQMQKDSLTGLYNKAATQDHIREMIARRPEGKFAFFILDIDNFKGANDQLGHAAGDAVLVKFAQTLKEQFREDDVVGRIGGDEFVAFMPVPDHQVSIEKARTLNAAQYCEFQSEARTWRISTSIGVALAPDAGTDFETLYKRADIALYQTKERGKNGFMIYESSEKQKKTDP